MTGTLWVVATPIGNLEDFSARARRILGEVAVIAAEDTRVSRKLAPARSPAPQWVSLNDHNETETAPRLIERLAAGEDVALVSDAGTPLVSDPGYRLVAAAHDAGIRVSPVPGPSAAVAALSAAGLACDRFLFEGFLPARSAARRTRLEQLAGVPATLIFYVPARNLVAVVKDLADTFGPVRRATIARELTKQFETVRRAPLEELLGWLGSDPDQARGEAVVLVEGEGKPSGAPAGLRKLARILAGELPPARAARVLTKVSDLDRKAAFALVESLRHSPGRDESGD